MFKKTTHTTIVNSNKYWQLSVKITLLSCGFACKCSINKKTENLTLHIHSSCIHISPVTC